MISTTIRGSSFLFLERSTNIDKYKQIVIALATHGFVTASYGATFWGRTMTPWSSEPKLRAPPNLKSEILKRSSLLLKEEGIFESNFPLFFENTALDLHSLCVCVCVCVVLG